MSKTHIVSVIVAVVTRIVLIVYVVLPFSILLFAREPEITATLSEYTSWAIIGLIVTILATWKRGWQGFVPCFALCLGALLYSMDARLWEPPSDADLSHAVAVITGANSGLGKAAALSMARMGAHVVVTCRSLQRCQDTVDNVNAAGKESGGYATAAILNLQSLESAYNLTAHLTAEYPRIHYLFNNAGSTPIFNLTNEGLEDGFGGMHLAHMALTLGLLPSLRNAGETSGTPSRIIMTSSEASITSALGILGTDAFQPSFLENDGEGDLRGEITRGDGTTMGSHAAYGRAKLCNNLFAFEINRRMTKLNWAVVSHSLHTGSVATKSASLAMGALFHGIPGLPFVVTTIFVPLLWRTADTGSRTLLFAALSKDPPSMELGGQYVDALCRPLLDNDFPIESKVIQEKMKALRKADNMWAERLWNVSIGLLTESPARDVVKFAP